MNPEEGYNVLLVLLHFHANSGMLTELCQLIDLLFKDEYELCLDMGQRTVAEIRGH